MLNNKEENIYNSIYNNFIHITVFCNQDIGI